MDEMIFELMGGYFNLIIFSVEEFKTQQIKWLLK
jgi:hypothetical protein